MGELINPEIEAENRRLAELRVKAPQMYGDVTDRPLLEVAHGR